ncbi:TetR/AcrR family transcriptional regulator [Nocardia alni]|uniref:TetR/AcrR family transcriptional regulator n=1 Tax=Nocardia alni TaxID=2815723 RepID=UPI001C24C5B1|nr:TetR/AcrR family transcriptional regulator [Nocardia alni]
MPDSYAEARAKQRRDTEARILAAASSQFAEFGYERTTIRGVASAAGVDAGLVMHYFGSKPDLFRRVIADAPSPTVTGTAAQVAEQILTNLTETLRTQPEQSLSVLRSMLTNPEAALAADAAGARYRTQIRDAVTAPDPDLRAAIVTATLLGLAVSRHLLAFDDIAAADPDRIVEILRPALRSMLGDDTAR